MVALRPILVASGIVLAAAATLAPAADAPVAKPVVTISTAVSPGKRPLPPGTSLTLRLRTRFSSEPAGGDFVLQRADFLFGKGARMNGALFPSCSAAKLVAAHGRLSVCPRGSKVGAGVATGRAVAVGVTSSGKLTIFNGPGGRSLTFNMLVIHPALINATFSAPIVRLHGGRYAFKLSSSVPPELQTILEGDIVVTGLDITTGATRTIDGRRRGYLEATTCPRGGSAIHGVFSFNQGASAVVDKTVAC